MAPAVGRLAASLACLALLAACAGLEHPEPGGESFESDDFRFTAPAGWEIQPSSAQSTADGGIVLYLANQALHEDCPASGSEVDCAPPINGQLEAGGILITWVRHACVA